MFILKGKVTVKRFVIFLFILILLLSGVMTLTADGRHGEAQTNAVDVYELYERDVVLIEFAETEMVRLRDGRPQNLSQSRTAAAVDELLELSAGGEWQRASTVSEEKLAEMRRVGQRRTGQPLPDLNNRLRLQLPEGMDAVAAQALFGALPIVEKVHLIPKPVRTPLTLDYSAAGNASGNIVTDPYQGYLDAAPKGLDARYAWQVPQGDGSGVNICDVEYDYNASHADINDVTFVGDPIDSPFDDNHGTAVLGMIGGSDNSFGVKGMAYGANLYFAAAKTTTGGYDVGNGVLECAAVLNPGDVILIEQQTAGPNYVPANAPSQVGLVPVEWVEAWYDDIQTAVAMGMVVVEAGGNGSQNLDSSTYTTGNGGHHPFLTANDSGAIIVGAGKSPAGGTQARAAESFSNYGATVDVQGWGGQIVTTGYSDLYNSEGHDLWYTRTFGGTSGASPMVTSAAAIVQAVYKSENGSAATPAQIKTILRNTGTAQTGSKNIGPLPDLRAAINSVADVTVVEPPVITPASGTYAMPLEVTISYASGQNSSNTHIRYTLDGSEPTFDDYIYLPEQGDTIYLLYGVTVKTKAFRVGGGESSTAVATYTSSTPKVATPLITPGAGSYTQPHQVTLSTSTPGATIRYRTDGRAPSFFYPGTEYTGPITLNAGSYEIVARGYKDGYYKSDAAYSGAIAVNEVILPAPTIYPSTGTYNGAVTAYMSSTVLGAEIRYTTDGSTPTGSSPLFSEPLYLTESTTLKARIYLSGYSPSAVSQAIYTVIQQAAVPTFSPPSGTTATGSLAVALSTTTAGATIRYTTNGAEPTSFSTAYSGPFNLNAGQHTVKAKAFINGGTASETATADYTVYSANVATVQNVVISPNGGNHTEVVTVTLSTTTEDADIYYTINTLGDPTTSDTLYTGPLVLEDDPNTAGEDNFIIRAKAFKSGYTPSGTTQTNFNLFTAQGTVTPAPSITPNGGVFTNTLSITIDAFSNPPFDVRQVRYTLDGSDPNSNTTGNSSPRTVSILKSTTVKAIGTRLGFYNSAISEAEFILVCDTPTLTAGGVYADMVEVSLSSGTTSAKIYYTTDGSKPTTASTLYNTPFTLTESATVRAFCTRTNFEDSDVATAVYVVNETPTAPLIDSQPQSSNVQVCETVTFAVSASGSDPLRYEWRKDGRIIAGEVEPELEIAAVQAADAGSYTVIVRNAGGAVTSNTAVLTVTGENIDCTAEAPEIISQPQSQSAAACSAVEFAVTATGTAPLSYQWLKDSVVINGETASTLTLDPVTAADGGEYTVRISNAGGARLSDVATLMVTGDDSACLAQAPTIEMPPQSQTAVACSAVVLSVTASGTRPFTYQWLKNGSELPAATNATLLLDPLLLADAGNYAVRVTNSVSVVTSTAAMLTVTGDDSSCGGSDHSFIYLPLMIR